MLNALRHFREVSVKSVGCVECVDNSEYNEILQGSSSEAYRLCRVGR